MKIPKYTILFLLSWLPVSVSAQADSTIATIEAKVESIDNAKGLSMKILTGEEILGQAYEYGGSLTGYYRNDSLVKMSLWAGLQTEIWVCDYYYDDTFLIYANEKQKPYLWDSVKKEFDYNHTTLKADNKYYLVQNELVRKTTNGTPALPAGTGKEAAQSILEYTGNFYRRLQQSPNKKIKAD